MRPTASASYAGCIRYNTQTYSFEGCSGLSPSWQAIGGSSGTQWAVSGSDISFSTGLVSFGKGLQGTAASTVGGPFTIQGAWTAPSTTHTVSGFYIADNCSGTVLINVKSPAGGSSSAKIGTATVSYVKTVGSSPEIFVVSSQQNANLAVMTITVVSNNIRVTTDANCSVCWTSTGAC